MMRHSPVAGERIMRPISLLAVALLFAQRLRDGRAGCRACSIRPRDARKAPHGAKVFIVSPKDGATVGQDVTVKFGVEGHRDQAGRRHDAGHAATIIC